MNETIVTNGCVTPKDWTVNPNARHDYSLTANAVYEQWLASQK